MKNPTASLRLLLSPIVVGALLAGASSAQTLNQPEHRRFMQNLKSTIFVPGQAGSGRAQFCSQVNSLSSALTHIRDHSPVFTACDESLQILRKNYCNERCTPPSLTVIREVWSEPDSCDEAQALAAWRSCQSSYGQVAALAPKEEDRSLSSTPKKKKAH